MQKAFVIGLDYGTDSVRALLVNAHSGEELGSFVHKYDRWGKQQFCDAGLSQFRQHPQDYVDGLEVTIKAVLKGQKKEIIENIKGISIDTTGSTIVAVDKSGTPLAYNEQFSDNPNALFILWKDHTANKEADEINELARKWEIDYTQYVGGIYSSEWFWAKILHILRKDEQVRKAAFSWVEHCDWISALLTGNKDPLTLKRSRCAAGHKAMWHGDYDGLPSEEFLSALDPSLAGLRKNLYQETYTSVESMGTISTEWAEKLGLPVDVTIGVGAFDCHMGAVGAEIEAYDFVRVMGTSTCDMMVVSPEEINGKLIRGICGQVDGSIIPNMIGLEAGQSAFGDYYAWFQKLIIEPVKDILGDEEAEKMEEKLIPYLSEKASKIPISDTDAVATDWINGRRTPDADHTLKASFSGLNLGHDAVKVFKMIVEATAFGSKAIVDRFIKEGVKINRVIAIGGVAKKSTYVMQTLSDVLNLPILVASADQACALGAAMNASVASGIHTNIKSAQKAMGSGFDKTFYPKRENVAVYEKLYGKYQKLGKLKL